MNPDEAPPKLTSLPENPPAPSEPAAEQRVEPAPRPESSQQPVSEPTGWPQLTAAADRAAEPTPFLPASPARPLASEELLVELEALRGEVTAVQNRLADLNRFVDTLHSENEQLRRRELERLQHPMLRDVMRLHDDWAAVADNWRTRDSAAPADVADKCAEVADDALIILERYGVELLAPRIGDLFDRKLHRTVAQIPAPEPQLAGAVASVRRVGWLAGEKALRFADVVVYAAPPPQAEPTPTGPATSTTSAGA